MTFVLGVTLLTAGRVVDAVASEAPRVTTLPLLKDPNVIGNMLGVAVLMSSMLIFVGSTSSAIALSAGLSAASTMTFSKGAWFMVFAGLIANVLALVIRLPRAIIDQRRSITRAAVFSLALVLLLSYNADKLVEMIALKAHTTAVDDSMGLRYRYALGGAYAMIDNPLFGVGYRNYYVVERMYPQLLLPPSDNAHNVFSQIAAIGGLPALLIFMLLFIYPFIQLWTVVRREASTVISVSYVASAVLVFFLSGAVQLQIVAQPFFWVFTGLVKGWRCNSSS
jgi:O-antigen ligase